MSRPKKTDAEIQIIREQILDAALAILQESGPEAITSRAIAESLGVAHMSLYTYFENQAAILRALRQREMAKWRAKQQDFERSVETEELTEVVGELLRFFNNFARENPNLYRMAWVMPEFGGESQEEDRQRMQTTVGQLASLIQRGRDQGVFKSPNPYLAAGAVLAMVNAPHILFHSGKLTDPGLRDQIAEEILVAAMEYLVK